MSATVNFTIKDEALAAARRLEWSALAPVVAQEVKEQNNRTVSHIQKEYLSFPKQQPTTMEGLRAISNRLRPSVRASEPTADADGIYSSIGSNVKYAAIHEFGGVIHRIVKPGKVLLREDAKGNLLRQPGHPRLAVFGTPEHKRVREVSFVGGKSYTITIPARQPIQRGINDRLPEYTKAIGKAVVKEFGGEK